MTPNCKTLLVALAAATLMTACAGNQPATPKAADQNVEPSQTAYEIEPWDGDGLDIPLDGSSMEAWNQTLARVKAHTSDENFITLSNSIDYLKFYDLSAGQNLEKLIVRLDGLTGREVIDRVAWQRFNPGRQQTKPGASDSTES